VREHDAYCALWLLGLFSSGYRDGGICALLIFINQDVLVKKEYPSNRRGQSGGIFAALLFGMVCSPFWWRWKQKNTSAIQARGYNGAT
jgi:type VI secretion system protein ImpL